MATAVVVVVMSVVMVIAVLMMSYDSGGRGIGHPIIIFAFFAMKK